MGYTANYQGRKQIRVLATLMQLVDWGEGKEMIHRVSKKSKLSTVHAGYSFLEDFNSRMCPKVEDAPVQTDTGKSGRHGLLLFSKKWGKLLVI